MAQTFWTGSSLSFTNGSKIVTVNTGPSVDSIYPNSKLKSGNYNEPVEVKAAYGNTIELYENWPGSTANTSATVTPSSAAAAAAGVAAQQVVTEIQNLVGSASATATENSFVKRDSNGRIKAASPSANDDVVTKGFVGSAATRDVVNSPNDSDSGKVLQSFGSVGYMGVGSTTAPSVIDANDIVKSGIYAGSGGSAVNFPGSTSFAPYLAMRRLSNQDTLSTFHISGAGGKPVEAWIRRTTDGGVNWFEGELYHSGNTNFNEFGVNTSTDIMARGWTQSATQVLFFLNLNSKVAPTGISVEGTLNVRDSNGTNLGNVSAISLLGSSSDRLAVLLATIPDSGLPEGVNCRLQSTSDTDKITVNF